MSDVTKCDTCDRLLEHSDRRWQLERSGPLLLSDPLERLDFCDARCLAPYVERLLTREEQRDG